MEIVTSITPLIFEVDGKAIARFSYYNKAGRIISHSRTYNDTAEAELDMYNLGFTRWDVK